MSSTMMSSPVVSLVAFLTNPLMLSYPATTLALLQLTLTENFTLVLATKPAFTFKLSISSLPPSLLFASATAAGVFWEEWAQLLFACYNTSEMQIFVTPAQIKIKVEGKPDVAVWSNPDIDERDLMSPVICIAQRAVRSTVPAQLLKAAFTRRVSASSQHGAIQLPTLRTIAKETPDYPSDSESEHTSDVFQFSDNASDSDRSSNTSASPSLEACELPSVKITTAPSQPAVAKTEVTKYLYQGGRTNVVGGGVMLGAPSPNNKKPSPASTPKPTPTSASRTPSPGFNTAASRNWRRRASPVLLAPDHHDSDNWRSRARV